MLIVAGPGLGHVPRSLSATPEIHPSKQVLKSRLVSDEPLAHLTPNFCHANKFAGEDSFPTCHWHVSPRTSSESMFGISALDRVNRRATTVSLVYRSGVEHYCLFNKFDGREVRIARRCSTTAIELQSFKL